MQGQCNPVLLSPTPWILPDPPLSKLLCAPTLLGGGMECSSGAGNILLLDIQDMEPG